jgi:hypothetical protein
MFSLPGLCPLCSEQLRQVRDGYMEHSDHHPKHGGTFFMSSDNAHHLEGTLPWAGEFRVYFYDNFTTPIDASFESVAEISKGGQKLDFKNDEHGKFLTAAIPDGMTLPLRIELRVKFAASKPAELFNLTFNNVTVEEIKSTYFNPTSGWVPTQ